MLFSCTTPLPGPRSAAPDRFRPKPAPVPQRLVLPEGWADITSRSALPAIRLWLVNREYSGTMILKELTIDSASAPFLRSGDADLLATISLRSKIPDPHPDLRVTRVPSVVDPVRAISSYAYIERGLLRRVAVFHKKGKIFELELMQEQPSAEFDVLTEDLYRMAAALYDR